MICRDVGERGGLRHRFVIAEHFLANRLDPVAAADGKHALDVGGREFFGLQVARVGCEQGDEMGRRRMAADVNAAGLAAVLADVFLDPAKGPGHVLNVPRMLHLRIRPDS